MADPGGSTELDAVARLVDGEQWSDALRALGPLRRAHESNPRVWELQALALRGAGELTEAQFAADRWAVLSEGSTDALRLKADLLAERGKHYAAAEVAEELILAGDADADAYLRLATYDRAAGLVPRARVAVQQALVLDPLRADTYELAGSIELAGGQSAQAATYFREALRIDPDNGRVAQMLQRAISAQSTKKSTARKSASIDKADSKARRKTVRSDDRSAQKQQRKADRKLGMPRSSGGSSYGGTSRRERIVGALIIAGVAALLLLARFR